MPLYTTSQLLNIAQQEENFAVGAFNVHNMEYTQAAVKAAEEENSPIILMIGEPMIAYAGLDMLANICMFAAKNTSVPVAVALDHGKNLEIINRCIELGLSIMVDGSHLPFEENIRFTKAIIEKASKCGLSVEGEIGSIGGSEDGEEVGEENMSDPKDAAEFVRQTGVEILAISIGNCHGLYKGTPKIDIERLKKIKEYVDVPLVMHGGSDLPEEISKKAVLEGIKKFNIGTDLKYAFSNKLKDTVNQEPMPFQPPHVLGPAREAVYEIVREKIQLFKSNSKADLYK